MGLGRYLPARVVRRLRPRPVDPLDGTICRAPFTSLHIDQFGDARPCCQSTLVVGSVVERSIEEIWQGEPLAQLRSAIADGDLSLGCEHCAWGGRDPGAAVYARRFDNLHLREEGTRPAQLELAPSNACNLQCTMCNGDWSSAIRLHREHRSPLPRLFDDDVLRSIEELLPGLQRIQFFGGEPFLSPESMRLMDAAKQAGTTTYVTTNGTILSSRVEALIDRPGMHLVVSVDGVSPEVYEAIRVGASWEHVERHLDRFCELAARNGNTVTIAHCLMPGNWWEFPDLLAWADRRGVGVYVNDVLWPPSASLHHLPVTELRVVVEDLERRVAEVAELHPPLRLVADEALAGLRASLVETERGARHAHVGPITLEPYESEDLSKVFAGLRSDWVVLAEARLTLAPDLTVLAVERTGEPALLAGLVDDEAVLGRRSTQISSLVAHAGGVSDAEAVLRDVDTRERRHDRDGDPLREMRTVRRTDEGLQVAFEYALAADERWLGKIADAAGDRPALRLLLDADGIVAELSSEARAAELGIELAVGDRCGSFEDAVGPERRTPPPDLETWPLAPAIREFELSWPSGERWSGLVLVKDDGVTVWLTEPRA